MFSATHGRKHPSRPCRSHMLNGLFRSHTPHAAAVTAGERRFRVRVRVTPFVAPFVLSCNNERTGHFTRVVDSVVVLSRRAQPPRTAVVRSCRSCSAVVLRPFTWRACRCFGWVIPRARPKWSCNSPRGKLPTLNQASPAPCSPTACHVGRPSYIHSNTHLPVQGPADPSFA